MLSVVIPAYNEEDGIASILDRVLSIKTQLNAAGIDGPEVLVVDDGSKDKTAEIVRSYASVRLLQHKINRNYGGALKTGFKNAKGDMIAFLDADGTYPPEYFPQLCNEVIKGADMVVGSRMAGEKNDSPMVRQLGNFVFASLVSVIGNRRVTDVASGMRVFRRDVLDRLYPLPNGLNFTPVMSVRAIHENIRLVEVPIPHSERDGHSKLNVLQDGMRFFNSIVWTALAYNPVRILGLIGLGGMALAALMFVVLLVMRLSGITELGRWGVFGVYAAMAAAVTGVSLFNLGAMFNYLITLFRKQPIRQGLLGRPLFKQPLDRQFWWVGSVAILIGVLMAVGSLVLSYNGWAMDRLWLYFLGSAAFILIGVQFVISWIVMRVLEELSKRDADVASDLRGSEIK